MARKKPPDSMEDMHFPLAGIDLSMGFERQTPRPVLGDYARTTPIGQNVRAFDLFAARARGGQRPGLAKYVATQIAGAFLIQELNYVVGVGYVPPGSSVPTIVQTKTGSIGSALSLGVTFTSPVTAGNTIVLVVTTGTFTNSVTDNQGNVYVAASSVNDNISGVGNFIFYAPILTGGSTTVTFHVSSLSGMSISITEVSGLSVTSPLIGSNSNTGTVTPATPGSLTLTAVNSVAFICVQSVGAPGGTHTLPPSGWTDLTSVTGTVPTEQAYKIFTTQQVGLNPAWTLPAVTRWIACGAAFGGGLTQQSQSGRIVTLASVVNGDTYVSQAGGTTWSKATNATGIKLNTSGVVRSAANNQKLWFADGTHYLYYDPSVNSVLAWTASAGTLPSNTGNTPRLICTYRGRTVLSGILSDPQNWFMSAVGNPTDWNYFPLPITSTQAVAGNNSPLGTVGDVITCMIPYTDDNLIFGGDHTIWMLTGDPMAGGSIDLVTDTIGMAWGNPWCRGPDGTLYFLSNKMGVYQMTTSTAPVRMSQQIEQLLSPLDTGANIARMQWNDLWQGFHVYITSATAPAATTHFFWEQRTGAWWSDVFANTNHNPLCCVTFDGNLTSDRNSLIGSWDGYVRTMTPTSLDDDGTPVASSVLIGPLVTKDFDTILLKDIQGIMAAAAAMGTVSWAVYVGATAEIALASAAIASGTWTSGRNPLSLSRWSGHAIFVKITATAAWAMEAVRARLQTQGKVQRRGL